MQEPKVSWLDRRIAAPGPFLALCLSPQEFAQAMRDCSSEQVPEWVTSGKGATMHTLGNHEGKLVCVVCISGWEGRDPCEVAGLLIHESVHVWQAYCREIGEREPGDEQEAYGIQSIAQELMTEFARRLCTQPQPAR